MLRGTIKAYSIDVNAGIIQCDKGDTYNFSQSEWNGSRAPLVEQRVTFSGNSRVATKIFAEA